MDRVSAVAPVGLILPSVLTLRANLFSSPEIEGSDEVPSRRARSAAGRTGRRRRRPDHGQGATGATC